MRPAAWLLGAALLVPAAGRAADEAPVWLRTAASAGGASSEPATVLLDEQNIAVAADGRITSVRRYVARIGNADGRTAAALREFYLTDGGRIRDVRAWIIRPEGPVFAVTKDHIVDLAAARNDVYNEVRVRSIVAQDQVAAGSVFGAEIVSESIDPFKQVEWEFDREWSARRVRRILTLPAGWSASSVTFGGADVQPAVTGTSYTWEIADLPRMESEPSSPPRSRTSLRVCVNYGAGGGGFADWAAVSVWLTRLTDASSATTPEIAATARQLTAGVDDPMEKVRRIARFVQSLQYISIQTGLGRGGGYKPHPAADVLARRYGDCKDKASLMRAMLSAVGVDAVLMTVYSGDHEYVQTAWPSPQQFNHCIIAIRLSVQSGGATVTHPRLGTLLIFDPTDPYTAPGSLPPSLLASRGLLVTADSAPLITLPAADAVASSLQRDINVMLNVAGGASVVQTEKSSGAHATLRRAWFEESGRAELVKELQARIARDMPGAARPSADPSDDGTIWRLSFDLPVSVRRAGNLLLMTPPVTQTSGLPDVSLAARKMPLEIDATERTDAIAIVLPDGYRIDELPAPVTLEADFGEFSATAAVTGNRVTLTRHLRLKPGSVAPASYPAVRSFVQRVREAEQSALVLVPPPVR